METQNSCYNYIVIRHRKENIKKCSLRGLEERSDFLFLTYPSCNTDSLKTIVNGAILLDMEGDPLSSFDTGPLIILDGTWVYAATMRATLSQLNQCVRRRIPGEWRTAYPRYQTCCIDPVRGLASIEAIYAASVHLGRSVNGLLDNYYWKDQFISQNRETIESST